MQHNLKKQLKCSTLKVSHVTSVRWAPQGTPQPFSVEKILKHIEGDPVYNTSDDLVAVVLDGELYVGPRTYALMAAVEDAGIPQEDFRMPFSDRDLPQGPALEKWRSLIEQAIEETRATTKARAFKAHKKPQPSLKPATATI